ncbi:MAG: low temperature requirement protein A [bacterium]|nr:low temperature requirement protein A [bacterium]
MAARATPYSSSKLPERFGLFTIIVLGETLVGVIGGVAEVEQHSTRLFAVGLLGMMMGLGLWWVYFDFIGRRACKPSVWHQLGYNYSHLPLMMAIVAVGAGINHVVSVGEWVGVPTMTERVLLVSSAVGLLALGVIESLLRRDENEPTHVAISPMLKIATALVVFLIAYWAPVVSAVQLMIMLVAPLLIHITYGAWVWFRQELPDSEGEQERS